jgi:hypothetical protein
MFSIHRCFRLCRPRSPSHGNAHRRLLTAAAWRMCVVLKEPLNVTYTATFKCAPALPLRLDHTLRYPVAPAGTGGGREPLPNKHGPVGVS